MSTTPAWRLVRLHDEHPVHAFTSGHRPGAADIDRYLRENARVEQAARLAAVWVVEDMRPANPSDTIVGFFSLSPVSVRLSSQLLEAVGINAPYHAVGGWLLGRMGLSVQYQGRGFGRLLVASAIRMARRLSTKTAGPLLAVDPANEVLMRWYLGLDFGFTRLAPADPRILRLVMKL